jgi:hypothetical protein
MKNITLIAVAALAAFSATPAFAADVESKAGARIVAPLQIANATPLYFGTIAPSLTANDQVVISPAGDKDCGAELTCMTDDHTAAAFKVSGAEDASYTIELPSEIAIVNGNGTKMAVTKFTGSKSAGKLVSGQDDFTVGGTLDVEAKQESGEYTGTFVVAVEYN